LGLGINNLVIYLLHGKLKLNFWLSKVAAIGIVTIWNFTMNYFFTF
jgi:putative flippase GtrA